LAQEPQKRYAPQSVKRVKAHWSPTNGAVAPAPAPRCSPRLRGGASSIARLVGEISVRNHTSCGPAGRRSVARPEGLLALVFGLCAMVGANARTPPLSGVHDLAMGNAHACALRTDGSVSCWGRAAEGQLGNGVSVRLSTFPVDVTALSQVSRVALAHNHSCALDVAGQVSCWGGNVRGELGVSGVSSASLPQPLTALPPATALAVGGITSAQLVDGASSISAGGFSCALSQARTAYCWGSNSHGQLGHAGAGGATPQPVPGLTDLVEIVAGGAHACARSAAGAVYCWGANAQGQLGDGSLSSRASPALVAGLGAGVVALAAGFEHSCAWLGAGEIRCWGDNFHGQLGDGSTLDRPLPTAVVSVPAQITGIAAGGARSCATTAGGDLFCWGSNSWGELGSGDRLQRVQPLRVEGASARRVAVGPSANCSVSAAGGVQCWGNHGQGTLGDGTQPYVPAPAQVQTEAVVRVSTSLDGNHACSVDGAGVLRCWGDNLYGQLGTGSLQTRNVPTQVAEGFAEVAAGAEHTCAISQLGGLWCWGNNVYGQLGLSGSPQLLQPQPVPGLESGVLGLALGSYHSCAITAGRRLACWGRNLYGQLGNGDTFSQSSPLIVPDLENVVEVVAGRDHTCVRTADQVVHCWGSQQQGQTGNGVVSTSPSLRPEPALGLAGGATAITAGRHHTCAIDTAGAAKCWGGAFQGALGNGDSAGSRSTPVQVVGLESGVVAIDAGTYHTCVALAAGGLRCWGSNFEGQAGIGSFEPPSNVLLLPQPVLGISSTVQAIAAGTSHTCAISSDDGALNCWGGHQLGQLGLGGRYFGTPGDVIDPRAIFGHGFEQAGR
jgi:alpha-tubulin suppressor-like RCC1 family protein